MAQYALLLSSLRLNADSNWIGLPEFVIPDVRSAAAGGHGFLCQVDSKIQGSPLGGVGEGVESADGVAGGGGDVRTDGAEDLGA